jgi:ankyrin repeat protein
MKKLLFGRTKSSVRTQEEYVESKERYPIREMASGLMSVVYVEDAIERVNSFCNKDTTIVAVSSPQLINTRSTYRLMKHKLAKKSLQTEGVDKPISPLQRPKKGIFAPLDASRLLHSATKHKDLALVKSILEYEKNISVKIDLSVSLLNHNSSRCTLLHTAAKHNCVSVLEYLLFGQDSMILFDIEAKDNLGATPLFYAVANNSVDCTQLLLSAGAQVNMKDHYGFFPLLVAVRNEHYDIADRLLMAGADIHSKTFVGDTALHVLIQDKSSIRAIQFLLSRGASLFRQNAKRETPLFGALQDHNLFDFLLYWLNTSQQRQHESFIPIVKAMSMTNDLGQSVIHRNCEIKGFDGVNNLMAIINALPFGNSSLMGLPTLALSYSPNSLVTSRRSTGKQSLKEFWSKPKPKTTKSYYEILLNEQDLQQHTPLMLAILYDNTHLVDVLVTAIETDLGAKNSKGETALDIAVRLDRRDAVRLILGGMGGTLRKEVRQLQKEIEKFKLERTKEEMKEKSKTKIMEPKPRPRSRSLSSLDTKIFQL